MSRYVYVEAEIKVSDVLGRLDDDELKEFGLRRIAGKPSGDEVSIPGFGYETPVQESIRMACLRGDLPSFIEATARMLDEEGIFLRTDRLLPPVREVAHG